MKTEHIIVLVAGMGALLFFWALMRTSGNAERRIRRLMKERRLEFSDSLLNRRDR